METIYSIVRESKTVYSTDPTAERFKVTEANHAQKIIRQLIGESMEVQECFYIMLLSRANEVLAVQRLSTGSQSGCVVDIRVVIKASVDLLAHGVLMFHNHPSGNLTPSQADKELTKKCKNALELIDIKLIDHIILSPFDNQFYSFSNDSAL